MVKSIEEFDAQKAVDVVVEDIRRWFGKFGTDKKAVIGISGGKDSTVAAALCVKALGQANVIGVLMPNGMQSDIGDSRRVCAHLGIRREEINIAPSVEALKGSVHGFALSEQANINLPPRIRMSTLYLVAQSNNGFVINTCNLSEDYVGYATKYGDAAGDYAVLKEYLTDEVIAMGRVLNMPEDLLVKAPSDGLCGKTDEDNLGFPYSVLNKYIRTGEIEDEATKNRIDAMHEANQHKERVIDRAPRAD